MKRAITLVPVLALLVLLASCTSSSSTGSTSGGSGSISTSTSFVKFRGTTASSFTVTASGAWKASTNQAWLSPNPSSGSGSATVNLTVDRSGLQPGSYAGSVLLQSGSASTVVTVYMRFAKVSGNVTGPSGQILPQSVTSAIGGSSGASYVPGQVLVKVSPAYLAVQSQAPQALAGPVTPPPVTPQAVHTAAAAVARAHGLSVQSLIAPGSTWAVLSTHGQGVPQAVAALRDDARVAAVQPNYLQQPNASGTHVTTAGSTPQSVPSDPFFQDQWDMTLLGMPATWDTVTGSADVVVGVVDSGVMSSHPDLQANVAYQGYDFVLNQPGAVTPASDGVYHGTHVAGTIGAVGNNGTGVAGMNWHLSILPVRVCDANGCPTSAIVRGIQYASGLPVYDGNGTLVTPPVQARVINMSFGCPITGNPSCPAGIPAEQEALDLATGNGTVAVASAGNDISNCSSGLPSFDTAFSPSLVGYPAAYPSTIAVGSVDYDQGTSTVAASCFSNGGAPPGGQGVTVAAPGGWLFDNGTPVPLPWTGSGALGIVSTYWDNSTNPGTPAYASLEGTSMAAPHVTGLVALMLAEDPALTPTTVKLMLAQTATGVSGQDTYLGWGLIDPLAAVDAARSSVTANNSDFIVRLVQTGSVVESVHADAGGTFTLSNVPAGSYTLEAGNDANHNGVLGDVGEFYGQTSVTVGSSGDVKGVGLNVQLQ